MAATVAGRALAAAAMGRVRAGAIHEGLAVQAASAECGERGGFGGVY